MKFINTSDLAKELNVDVSAVQKEISHVISELPNAGTHYLLYNQDGSSRILAVTAKDVEDITSGFNKVTFLDLVTHFKLTANDMAWLLKELVNKGIVSRTVEEYYIEVRNKPLVRAWFEPEAVMVGEKSTLSIEINTPYEIQGPEIALKPPTGLELEEQPKTPTKIFKGKFMEKYEFLANTFGDLKVGIALQGIINGAFYGDEAAGAALKVLPLPPELVISESKTDYEAAYQGTFRLTLDITNRGAGAAKNVELKGLDLHPEFEALEPTMIGYIASRGSVKFKIAVKPRKSGIFTFNDLAVGFENLIGQPFSVAIPDFEVQVTTPQPRLKVEFLYPEGIDPKRVFPLTIKITNIGEGDARNITFTLPIDHRYIQSGIVDCNIPKLRSNQTEEVIIRLQAPEKNALEFPDLKIEYDDSENNTNLQKVFGVVIPIRNTETTAKHVSVDHTAIKWPFNLNARIGGQYDIVEEVGEGGFAKVYRVRRLKFNEEWALKALKAEFVTIPAFEESFVEEAKVSQKLREDHIVGVQYVDIQAIEDLEFPYIIMEYIKGGTLKDKLKEPLDLMTFSEVMKDMCSALLYAHQQGVIHFDVKPSNIFYDDCKRLWKLGDFGLSKPITTSSNVSPRGSLPYMAPEVKQRKGTSKSDIYSLGRVGTEILTGSPDGDLEKADKDYPRESKQKVKEFAAILQKMLNPVPTERPTIVEIQRVFLKSATWSGNERRRAI